MELKLENLKTPMPYKWKVNNNIGNKVLCVAYVDSRQVQDKLDEVCGADNWQDDYKVINGNMYAGVGVNVGTTTDPRWVWKWDCGTQSNTEKEKGESSDAFKRAAVKWGVGRFLYSLDMHRLETKEYGAKKKKYPVDKSGNILWDGMALTNFINGLSNTVKPGIAAAPAPRKQDNSRYDSSKGGANVPYTTAHTFSPETIKKVQGLSRGDKRGKDVLKEFIPEFNKKFSTSFVGIMDFSTDALINQLIDFVDNIPPKLLGK